MKQLRHYIRRVGIIRFALFALLALYGVYSLTNYGGRWFSTSALRPAVTVSFAAPATASSGSSSRS